MCRLLCCVMIFIFSTLGSAVKASEQTANPPSKHDIALGGQVNLQGIILSSACDITAGDRWQSIEMAPETRGHMKRVGEGEPKPFSIHLTGCSLAAADDNPPWQYLRITFDGVDKNGLFPVEGAGGVALQLVDQNGDVVTPGKMVPYRIVSANDIQLDYQVRLKSTMENLLMGSYQTTIKYHVEYF